ncbi:MAG TPA: cation-transporting P-type ATPase, partial [Mycobacteriales bacterium]|nr:cation-transporting P-type ATPase [Mycobacteriales bacterium]
MTTTRSVSGRTAPWTLSGTEVAAGTGTDPARGLPAAEAAARLAGAGGNELATGARRPVGRLVLAQLTDTMIVVLLAAAALTAAIGDLTDMTVILAVVAVNTTLGVVQEVRAGRAISALTALTAPMARVVRDGDARLVPAREVVEGDLLRLAAGDIVPADARLLLGESLEVDEAALTGESVPVPKRADARQPADTPLADRVGMLLSGTVVTRGRADAVVTATGSHSALGGIARMLEEHQAPSTPLQRSLSRLGRQLSVGAAALCLLVAVLGLLRGEPLDTMLVTAVSLAVAAIPESLPAVETLGSVTVIASDKTGTLTEGTMAVELLWTPAGEATVSGPGYSPAGRVRWPATGRQAVADLLLAGVLCNDAELVPPDQPDPSDPRDRPDPHGPAGPGDPAGAAGAAGGPGPGGPAGSGDPAGWQVDGDPTEGALLAAAARGGVEVGPTRSAYPRLAEVPFDAATARMTTAHRSPAGTVLVVCKGAPESVLDPGVLAAPPEILAAARAAADELAATGHRVLAVAWSTVDTLAGEPVTRDLRLLGLVGMTDPLRPAAGPAVAAARTAGITPVIITGDHPAMVGVLARRLGVLSGDDAVVTGRQLAAGDTRRAAVYARVAPEQKLDVIRSWQQSGAV